VSRPLDRHACVAFSSDANARFHGSLGIQAVPLSTKRQSGSERVSGKNENRGRKGPDPFQNFATRQTK
jgi:hypothetical protein